MKRRTACSLFLLVLLAFFFGPETPSYAQNVEGQIIASEYGEYQVWGSGTNTFIFTPASCQVSGGGRNFAAFTYGLPILIADPGNPAIDETVIAGLVNIQACSVQLTPLHKHIPPFYLTSGTGGLQEAINANLSSLGADTIILSAEWYRLGGSAATIASVTGNSSLRLEDITTTPATWYQWNGSQYVAVSGSGGVGSLNSLTGAVNITPANSNVTVAQSGSNIQIGFTGAAGISSINGDKTPTQSIVGTGGINCSTTAGTTTCNYAGLAGSGAIGSGGPYNESGYTPGTAGTTIGPETDSYTLPLNLSTSQINTVLGTNNIRVHIQNGDAHTPFSNSTHHDPIVDDRSDVPALSWNVKASGAQCDVQVVTGQFSSTTNAVTGHSFSSADIGKTIMAVAPNGSGVPTRYIGVIQSIAASAATCGTSTSSGVACMVGNSPFTTVSGWDFTLGHDDYAALSDALSLGYSGGVQIELPKGKCFTSQPLKFEGQNIVGQGVIQSAIIGAAGEDVLQASDPSVSGYEAFQAHSHMHDFGIYFDAEIDASKAWQACNDSGCTTENPLYRPIGIGDVDANYPLNAQWIQGGGVYGQGAINGAATVTNGSAVVCIPTSSPYTETLPTVGNQILFPYQAANTAMFETTVVDHAGAGCATGYTGVTLAANWPYSSGTQQEWFSGTSIQNIQTAIPDSSGRATATITGVSLTSDVVTFTASNSFIAGQTANISGLTSATYLNGQRLTVLSAGLSGSQFEANYTHANDGPYTGQTGLANPFPMVVQLANSITPNPQYSQAGMAPFGIVQIDGEQCSYYGISTIRASTTAVPSLNLTACAQNGSSAAAHNAGTFIFPLNPVNPTSPWPVVPTLNSGTTTPSGAEFYPAVGLGNAAIAFPIVNGKDYNPGQGPGQANWHDLFIADWPTAVSAAQNPIGYQLQNDTAGIYLIVLPFDSKFENIYITDPYYGIAEGTPSTNSNYYFGSGFPTADGNSWNHITVQSAAYPLWTIGEGSSHWKNTQIFSQSGAPPNNTWPGYTPAYSGGMGGWIMGGPYGDQGTCCNNNTGMQYTHFDGFYIEAENGALAETQPLFQLDCDWCVWTSWTPKSGGVTYIGGDYQHFSSALIAGAASLPIINFGRGNVFDDVLDAVTEPRGNIYGDNAFLSWGPNTQASGPAESIYGIGGPIGPITYGNNSQPVLGQTNETFNTGNVTAPYTSSQDGLIQPFEFNTSHSWEPYPVSVGWTLDAQNSSGYAGAPITQSYVACNVGTDTIYDYCASYRFNENYIYVGPGQRLVNGKYTVYAAVKEVASPGNSPPPSQSFNLELYSGAPSGTCMNGGTLLTTTVPVTPNWVPVNLGQIDLSSLSGNCYFGVVFQGAATAAAQIQLAYLDLAPVAQNITAQQLTITGTGAVATISAGTGTPTGCGTTYANGSLYVNTSGTTGSILYACIGTTWTDIK